MNTDNTDIGASETTKPLTLDNVSEAIKTLEVYAQSVWGIDKEQVTVCPNDDYEDQYSKHSSTQFCPHDGRKLKTLTREVSRYEQTWFKKLIEAITFEWQFAEWRREALTNKDGSNLAGGHDANPAN